MSLRYARVSESCIDRLIRVYQDSVTIEPLPHTYDYVYNASDLINLPGKNLVKRETI